MGLTSHDGGSTIIAVQDRDTNWLKNENIHRKGNSNHSSLGDFQVLHKLFI